MNWNLPTLTDLYGDFLTLLKDRDMDLAKGMDPAVVTVTNPVTNMLRWNSANARWELYNGSSWVALVGVYAITVAMANAVATAAISNAMLRDSAGVSIIGRSANSTGAPADIVAGADDRLLTRVSGVLAFTQLTAGMAANALWTYAKIQDISATDRILGRSSAGAGSIQEIACTSAGRALIDDADAAAQRTTLDVPKRDGTNASGTWGISVSGNAATVAGYGVAEAATVSTVAARNSSGYLFWVYGNQSSGNSENPTVSQIMVTNGSDNYMRKCSIGSLNTQMRGPARAWINCDNNGNIRSSFNISSITDAGTGYVQVNTSFSFGSTNYVPVASGDGGGGGLFVGAAVASASQISLVSYNTLTQGSQDIASAYCAFFGD